MKQSDGKAVTVGSDVTLCDGGVDVPELLARVEYDHSLLEELFDIFREEYPGLRNQMRAAIDRADLKEIEVAAHTLKGMLASLSFCEASACALQIERAVLQGSWDSSRAGIVEEMARLDRMTMAAERHLETVLRETIQ